MNTYEKKYKEALSKAKDMLSYKEVRREDMEYLFPELAESEDEKTKRILHSISSKMSFHLRDIFTEDEFQCFDAWSNAWLEKQGEQKPDKIKPKNYNSIDPHFAKPIDKVEPKFKVGDWISGYYTNYKVLSINNEGYVVEDVDGNKINILFENEKFHYLWTIQDAKDGDVLCTYECDEPKIVFILKGMKKKHYALSYHCYYNIMYPHFGPASEKGCLAPNDENVKPATKAQRDALMKAMTNAGYTFDFEKKELKKKEQDTCNTQLTEFEDAIKDMMNDYRDAIGDDDATVEEVKKHSAYLQSLISQNPAWSEEDTFKVQRICKYLDEAKKYYADIIEVKDCIDWLKSLKYRN